MDITTIIKWCALAIIIVALLLYYYFKVPKGSDKTAAKEFVKGYTTVFEGIIRRIIMEVDITKFHSIEEFQSSIYTLAYDECWKYVEQCVAEASANCNLKALVQKCITRECVEAFINEAMSILISKKCSDVYVARVNDVIAQAEEEDKRLQKEADEYETGTKVVEPYEEPEEEDKTANLNPQRDDEEEYTSQDDSQEIVNDSTPTDESKREPERETILM